MSDRTKTARIPSASSFIMFSPLAMALVGFRTPMVENLGFARNAIDAPTAWVLAAVTAIASAVYAMRAALLTARM